MGILHSACKKALIFSILYAFSMQASAEYYLTYPAETQRNDFAERRTYICNPCCCYSIASPHRAKHSKKVAKHHYTKKHHARPKTGWYEKAHWVNGHWVAGAYLGEGFNVYPRKTRQHMTPQERDHYDADLTTGDDNPYLNPDMDIDY